MSNEKETFSQVLEELLGSLGLSSFSKLWQAAGVNPHRWYRLADAKHKSKPTVADVKELLAGLREHSEYRKFVSANLEKQLLSATGVTLEVVDSSMPPVLPLPVPPPPPDHFKGRTPELTKLKNLLGANGSPSVQIVGIQGMGGIGKTSLAGQLAHDLYYKVRSDSQFEVVLWVNVTREFDLVQTLISWASYPQPNFRPNLMPQSHLMLYVKALLEKFIQSQRPNAQVLVVFDDVWENTLGPIRILKQAIPEGSSLLITSRSEKVTVALGAKTVALGPFRDADGVEMLQEYLPNVESKLLIELVRVLGGHPLALVLASRRILLAARGTDQNQVLREHLMQYREGLPTGADFAELDLEQGEDRNDNLRLSFWYSYNELSAEAKARFRALGATCYDQPYSLSMLMVLWNAKSPAQTAKFCQELCNLSFLERIEKSKYSVSKEDWYNLHPLLHTYALGLIKNEPKENNIIFDRYQQFMLEVAEQFEELPPEEWNQLSLYQPHLQVIGQVLEKQITTTAASPAMLEQFSKFNTSIFFSQRYSPAKISIEWLDMNIDISHQLANPTREALFLTEKARLLRYSGDYEKAYALHQQAIALEPTWAAKYRKHLINENYLSLAFLRRSQNLKQESQGYLIQGLAIAHEWGYSDTEVLFLSTAGYFYYLDSDYNSAEKYLEQALRIAQSTTNLVAKSLPYSRLGMLYQVQGNFAKSKEFFEQSLEFSRKSNDINEITASMVSLGRIALDEGEYQKALEYFQETYELRKLINYVDGQASALKAIAETYLMLGQLEQVYDILKQVMTLEEPLARSDLDASRLGLLGWYYVAKGEIEKGLKIFENAIAAAHKGQTIEIEIKIYLEQGDALRSIGKLQDAAESYRHGLVLAKKVIANRQVKKLQARLIEINQDSD